MVEKLFGQHVRTVRSVRTLEMALFLRRDRRERLGMCLARAGVRRTAAHELVEGNSGMKFRRGGGFALVCLSLNACAAGDAGVEENLGEAEASLDFIDIFPGRGFFQNSDGVASDCLVPAAFKKDPDSRKIEQVRAANVGGQEVIYSLTKIESSEDLQRKLNISASASANFLVGGADAKFKFSEDVKLSSTAVTLLASVIVRNASWTVPPGIKFDPEVEPLLTAGNEARFRALCGDAFVHSITTGGEFYAVVQIQTNSEEERQRISSSIEGNYFTAKGSAEFNSEMKRIVQNSTVSVASKQIGGKDADADPCLDVKCVASRVSALPASIAAAPVTTSLELLPYDVVTRKSDAVSRLDITTSLDTMRTINQQRNFTRDKLNQLVDVQSRSSLFALGAPNATLAEVTSAIASLNGNMTKLGDALKACVADYTTCKVPTSLANVTTKVPPAKSQAPVVMLRPYNKPSAFLADGYEMLSPCNGNLWAGTGAIDDRAQAPAASLKLVPGVSGLPGSISFQSLLEPSKLATTYLGPSCSKRVKFMTVTTASDKEKATFVRVPGLNGQPNTWSFRLQNVVTAEPYRNTDANTYLSLSRVTPISVQTKPDTSDAATLNAFNDAVSWYVDQQ